MRNHLTKQLFLRNLRHLAHRWLVFLEKFAKLLQMETKTTDPQPMEIDSKMEEMMIW